MRRLTFVVVVTASTLLPGAPANAAADPFFPAQWGLASIRAEQAWTISTGSGTTIAVIDTGVDLGHPDLAAKLRVLPGSNIACGGGALRRGRCDPNRPDDDNGHGTHVAGIAAAITGNGEGVAGTAPAATILPVKVLDSRGSGSVEQVAAGIRFATQAGADVINLSLGELPGVQFLPRINDPIDQALEGAWAAGVTIVAAAGNESAPLCSYPAAHARVLCVGAVDRRDVKTFYSNFGVGIGLVAPGGIGSIFCDDGEDIWSTFARSKDTLCRRYIGYETLAGTSMATPFVAGTAALVAAMGLGNAQIVERIRLTSDDLGTPGFDPVFGHGRVNAARAVTGS